MIIRELAVADVEAVSRIEEAVFAMPWKQIGRAHV